MNKFKFIFISFILIVLVPFSVSADDLTIEYGGVRDPEDSISLFSVIDFDNSSVCSDFYSLSSSQQDFIRSISVSSSASLIDDYNFAFISSDSTVYVGKGIWFTSSGSSISAWGSSAVSGAGLYSLSSSGSTSFISSSQTISIKSYFFFLSAYGGSDSLPNVDINNLSCTAPELFTVSLSSSPSEGGIVSGSGSYSEGSVITISAVPNQSFTFIDWSDGNNNSTRQITVNSDISLTANFKYDGLPTPSKPDISDDITNYPEQSDQINSNISIGSTSGGSGGSGSILYTVTDFYNVYTLPRVTWNALIDKQKLECDVSKQPYVCTYQYDDYSDPDDPRNKYLTFEYFTNPYDSNIFLYAYSYSQLSIKGPNIVVSDGASLIKVGTGLPEPFDIKYAYVFGDNVIARDIDTFDYIYTDNVAHVSDNLEQLSSFIQSLPYDTYNLSYQGQVSVSSDVIKSGSYSSIVIGSGDTTLTLYAAISDSTSTVQTINVQVNQLIQQEQNNLTNSELADVNKELDNMNNLIENGNSESQNASIKLDDSYSSFIDVSDHFDSLEQNYLDSLSSQLGDLDISFDLGNNSDFVNSANFVKTNFDKLVDNPFGIIIGFSLAIGICLLMLGKRL